MGVASIVLGILSLVVTIFTGGILGWLGIIFGVVGIILGAIGRKNPEDKAAMPGLIISGVGTGLGVILFVACIACLGAAGSSL